MPMPSGYKLLEYIKSSGTQYIDTNLSMASGFRAEIDIEFTSLASSKLSCIIGAHNDSSPYGRSFLAAQTSLFQIGMGDGYYNFGSPTTGEKYHIDFSNVYGNAYCKINGIGQTLSEAATGTNSYSVNTLYLLAVHGGEYWFQKVSGNTYHCKIYSTEGTLVRDYIPCQTTTGEIGLWDDVNSVFYGNAGTGTFTAGPVIAIATDESEITKLEYIQSSGTEYINSGVSAPKGFKVDVDFEFTKSSSAIQTIIGSHETASPYYRNYFAVNANMESWNAGFYDALNFGSSAINTRYHVQYCNVSGKISCVINDVDQGLNVNAATNTARSGRSLYILAMNYETSLLNGTAKLYACKIDVDDTLVRDYIPCQTSSGEIGLWDALNKMFYSNAGTGTFIAGPYCISSIGNAKIGGEYKNLSKSYVKVDGVWKSVSKILGKKDIWCDLR